MSAKVIFAYIYKFNPSKYIITHVKKKALFYLQLDIVLEIYL